MTNKEMIKNKTKKQKTGYAKLSNNATDGTG
jgi:hypothetical protein